MKKLAKKIIDYLKEHPDVTYSVSELARQMQVPITEKKSLRTLMRELSQDPDIPVQRYRRQFYFGTPAQKPGPKNQSTPRSLSEAITAIIEELSLPKDFPDDVIAVANHIHLKISTEERQVRRDLKEDYTLTIDGETARDFDDAISIQALNKGHARLRVSIADVSHYVEIGSLVDREAYVRGTSVYFPDRVLPMLPEHLSNNICSLVPGEERLTFTAEIEFDSRGQVIKTEFYKSIILSQARLTYTQVAKALIDQDADTREEIKTALPHLETMHTLFKHLRAQRLKRGSLDFDLPEPQIIMDMESGQVDQIVKAERTEAHMMIEEFMIAANEAVARFITSQDQVMIYRIHDQPNREKLKDLQRALHNLGYSLRLGRGKVEPRTLATLITQSQKKPEGRMIHTLMLRSLAKAVYDTENVGHFGLASACYTHFTSPIRRYPDLIVHRILSRLVHREKRTGKKTAEIDLRQLSRSAEHCSLRERNAMEAEWAVRDLVQAYFMQEHVGKTFSGVISSVTRFGLFIELDTYFVEGLVPIRQLDDDYYVFVEERACLIGRRHKKKYQIGQKIWVRIANINIEKRWIDMDLAPAPSATT